MTPAVATIYWGRLHEANDDLTPWRRVKKRKEVISTMPAKKKAAKKTAAKKATKKKK